MLILWTENPVSDADFDAGFSAVKAAEWRVAKLMRGNPGKSREHLRELERLCRTDCEEYRYLEKAIADFDRQAGLR